MRSHKRLLIARRVIVNLHSGRAVNGVLVDENGPLLVLRNAELLERGVDPTPVDGEIVIDTAQVDFIQAL